MRGSKKLNTNRRGLSQAQIFKLLFKCIAARSTWMEDNQRPDIDDTAGRFDGSYYIVGDTPNKDLSMTFTHRPLLHTCILTWL
jgi:hypothetical protein